MESFNAAHDQGSKHSLFVIAMVTGSNLDLVGLILICVIISHSSFKKSGWLKRKRVLLGMSLRFAPKFPCFTQFIYKNNHATVLFCPLALLLPFPLHSFFSGDHPTAYLVTGHSATPICSDLSLPVSSQTRGGC